MFPHQPQPKKYGAAIQDPMDDVTTPNIDETCNKTMQQIVGMVLCYERANDLTLLPGLSVIVSEQADAKESIENRVQQILDQLATHPDPVIGYYASDMILNIYLDAP